MIKRLPQGRCVVIRKHPGFSASVVDVVVPASSVPDRKKTDRKKKGAAA